MPIPRKRPVISGRYQSQQVTPTMSSTTVRKSTPRIQACRLVSGVSAIVAPSVAGFCVLLAYTTTKMVSNTVRMAQQKMRYPMPEKRGRSAIPCAIPTVKGFRKALEKPMLDAT